MSITAAGDVGIGPSFPTAKLDVTGTGLFRSGNTASDFTNNQILFSENLFPQRKHAIKSRHNSGGDSGNSIDFFLFDPFVNAVDDVGTKHVMTLDGIGTGSVGIGTTTPTYKLDVSGVIHNSAQFRNTSVAPGLWMEETDDLIPKSIFFVIDQGFIQFQRRGPSFGAIVNAIPYSFNTNAPENTIRVLPSGNVGIATPSPNVTLDVTGKPADATAADGVMIPRMNRAQLTAKNAVYGASQTSALIYVDDITGGDTVGQRVNVTSVGIYVFTGVVWIKL